MKKGLAIFLSFLLLTTNFTSLRAEEYPTETENEAAGETYEPDAGYEDSEQVEEEPGGETGSVTDGDSALDSEDDKPDQEAAKEGSEETVPGETIPEGTVPDEVTPEETTPEETTPEETVPEETTAEEANLPNGEPEGPEEEGEVFNNFTYIYEDFDTSLFQHSRNEMQREADYPSRYSLVDQGLVTSVKNQNPYGTCWTFATMGSAESGLLCKGYSSADLAELQLAYYTYSNYGNADPMSLIVNDGTSPAESDKLNVGGNIFISTFSLASGIGFSPEDQYPYSSASSYTSPANPCYHADNLLRSVNYYDMAEKNAIKRAVMEKGALSVSYWSYDSNDYHYHKSENGTAYYQNYYTNSNHAVTLVGWDDNFSRNNFYSGEMPAHDGAWLIKNSWGESFGDNGYFWISYDDPSIANGMAAFYDVETNSAYQNGNYNLYQYDGSANSTYEITGSSTVYESNVFRTMNGVERLSDVGIMVYDSQLNYTISVYRYVKDIPTSGTLVYSQDGYFEDAGYHLVTLDQTVSLVEGERFAIVVRLQSTTGKKIELPFDMTEYDYNNRTSFYNDTSSDFSYYSKDGKTWTNWASSGKTARIKAITINGGLRIYGKYDDAKGLYPMEGTFKVGESFGLWTNDTSGNILWASSDSDIVRVKEDGLMYTLSSGTAVITAQVSGSEQIASYYVTVEPPKAAPTDITARFDENWNLIISSKNKAYLSSLVQDNYFGIGLNIIKDGESSLISNALSASTVLFYDSTNSCVYVTGEKLFELYGSGEISVILRAFDYEAVSLSDTFALGGIAPTDLNLESDQDGIRITSGNADYLANLRTLTFDGRIYNISDQERFENYVFIELRNLSQAGVKEGYYDIILTAENYKNKVFYGEHVDETELSGTQFETEVTAEGIVITSNDSDWLNGLSSAGKVELEFGDYLYAMNSEDLLLQDEKLLIKQEVLQEKLPGVNNRIYTIILKSPGYNVCRDNVTISGLTAKSDDVIQVTFDAAEGRFPDGKSIIYYLSRGELITTPENPVCAGKNFDGWYLNNTLLNSGEAVSEDCDDLLYTACYSLKSAASAPYASIKNGSEVKRGTRVILASKTIDSVIYYTLDGSDPDENAYLYDGPITIDDNTLIRAIACREDLGDSEVVDITYSLEANGWGDIVNQEDQEKLGNDVLNIPSGIWTSDLEPMEYAGTALKPEPRVYYENKLLKLNTDYTLKYSNNTNVSTNPKIVPLVTITLKGNYAGTIKLPFVIEPKDISECTINDIFVAHTGKKILSKPVVKDGTKTLALNKQYQLVYDEENLNYTDSDEYPIVVRGIGNYKGTKTVREIITQDKLISKLSISVGSVTYENRKNPVITIKDGKTVLNNELFDFEYSNSEQVGTASVEIKAKESSGYAGTIFKTYKITGTSIARAVIGNLAASYPYTGEEIQPAVTVTLNGEELTKDNDYTLTFQKNKQAGTATLIITGTNGKTGTVKKTFKITSIDLSTNPDVDIHVDESAVYALSGAKAGVEITYKSVPLVQGTDYTVSYANNRAAGKTATVTITGKGNFAKTVKQTFTVEQSDISSVSFDASDKVFEQKKNRWKGTIKLTDSEGKKLSTKDYTITSYTYEYDSFLTDGTLVHAGDVVNANDIPAVDTIIRVSAEGKGNYKGSTYALYRIIKADIAKASVSIPVQYYFGEPVTLTKNQMIVKQGSVILNSYDYEIVSFANNEKTGNASVTIKGQGAYGGVKTVTFKITARPYPYTVIYNGNGFSGGRMANSANAVVQANKYVRKGYTFVEWNTREDGSGISYQEGEPVDITKGSVVLYAIWAPETYHIDYELDGGAGGGEYVDTYQFTDPTFLLPVPEKIGYTFRGWYTDAKYRTKLTAINQGSAADYHLYAKWTKDTYTIKYVMNGGSKTANITKYNSETDFVLLNPTRAGYNFAGWYKDAAMTERITSIKPGTTGNLTLYASFKPIVYYINFHNNGIDTEHRMPVMALKYDQSYTLSHLTLSQQDYVFKGWNTKPDGTGKMYTDGQTVKNLTNVNRAEIDLYAQWQMVAPEELYSWKNGYDRIPVEWVKVDSAKGYYIYRSTSSTTGFKLIQEISNNGNNSYIHFDDTDALKENTKYYYKVSAYYIDGGIKREGALSKVLTAATSKKPNFGVFLDRFSERESKSGSGGYSCDNYPDIYVKNSGTLPLTLLSPIYIRPDGKQTIRTAHLYDTYTGMVMDDSWYYTVKADKKWYWNRYFYTSNEFDGYDEGKTIVDFEFVYDGVRYTGKCSSSTTYIYSGGYRNTLIGYWYKD